MTTKTRILILDNGAPISPEILVALADRGVRVDTSAPQQHKLFEQHKEEEDMRASRLMATLLSAGLARTGFARTVPARELLPKTVQAEKTAKAQAKRERKQAQRLRLEHLQAERDQPLAAKPLRDTVAPLTLVAGEEK